MDYNGPWLQPQINDLQTVSVPDERSAGGSNDWKETAASVQGGGMNDFLGDIQGEHEHFWTDAGHSDALGASRGPLDRTTTNAHPVPATVHHSPTPPLTSSTPVPYTIGLQQLLAHGQYGLQFSNQWLPAANHLPLSSYSSLNGATSSSSHSQMGPQGQGQGQGQPQAQGSTPMVIDPALTTMNGSSSSPPPQYQQPAYLTQQPQSRMQYQFSPPAHQSMLSINPAFVHSPVQYQQSQQQQQQHSAQLVRQSHSPPQQQQLQQGTLSPFALHSPTTSFYGGISPATFYGHQPQPVAGPSSSSTTPSQTPSQTQSQSAPTPPSAASTSKAEAEQRRTTLIADVKPLIQPNSFTGGGAVAQLANILDDYGIAEVDASIRLDVLTKIRDNAGNHYFRAWVDNSIAMEIVREWLKLAFMGREDQQMVETIMPLLQIIDRLPFNIEKLKQSKLGKLIMKLIKDPPTPGELKFSFINHMESPWHGCCKYDPNENETDNSNESTTHDFCRTGVSHAFVPVVVKYMYLTTVPSSISVENKIAIKDMAANIESKWRKMLSRPETSDKADNEEGEDPKGKKRRADSVSKSAPPAKRTAVPAAGSSTPKAVAVKRDTKPVVKDAKSDSSFFSKPKPTKKELPSFKKTPPAAASATASSSSAPAKKAPDASVAQPSSMDGFQEILKSWGGSGAGPSTSTPPPAAPGPSAGPSTAPPGPPGGPSVKRKKSVTWAPDSELEQIRLIERAVYDDDGATGSLSTHNLRDLDRDEGAALHNHLFEEQTEWTEPQPLEIPPEIEIPPRGGESQERAAQEERERTALVASYASPAQIPDSPAEPPTQIPEEQVDDGVRLMLTGPAADAIFWDDGVPALVDTIRPATSVAELVEQLAAAAPALAPDVTMSDATPPPSIPPMGPGFSEHLQLVMQQAQQALAQGGMFGGLGASPSAPTAPPTGPAAGGEQGWGGQYTEFDRGYYEPNGAGRGADPNRRWGEDGPGPAGPAGWGDRGGPRGRGRGGPPMRGRGRGDGFRNNGKRRPCSFFHAGRCRYGDQCDYSHEPLNYN
ncbi:hypothetical protein C8Q77DRAFT_379282 [Trametes polyzona]|nr:hypothetical protein C8Q77DRAFT_379282 [Trametes polyzona]